MDRNVTLTAVDGTDALAFVIIRPGQTEGGVSIEAAATGLSQEGAAHVLRHVANQWDGGGDDLSATLSALNALAERYENSANGTTTTHQYIRQAARDIRFILTAGRLPARLMTDAELEALLPSQDAELVDEEPTS
ncbi:hypothetical protein [Streptomyces sp. OR43]|uniref:hypothetical protein n=1 Tax=Streptomyces sp. or43 TaxID=2478957 RepID=UPI0011CE42E2|nr:hypothetical protein [Streptomyces sp. or43]TXS44913.1 hypothetical protein EAO72_07770 [Streptomyces sp. or43]